MNAKIGGAPAVTFAVIVVVALAEPAVPLTGILKLPAASDLSATSVICAPAAGTLNGNVVGVDNPAGKLPRLMVGVTLNPVTEAFTVIVNVVPAYTVKVAGVLVSTRPGAGDCGCWPELPPPQPDNITVAVRHTYATAGNWRLNKAGTKISPGEEK